RGGAWRAIAATLGVLVTLAIIASVAAVSLLSQPQMVVAAGAPVQVVIAPGSSTAAIAESLKSAGVIDNALVFRWKARRAGVDGTLKAGEYDMTTGMSFDDVVAMLTAGTVIEYVDVTIPEGFTATQAARRIAEVTGLPEAELTALMTTGAQEFVPEHPYLEGAYGGSLEGYLFPATYRVREGMNARDVVEMMLDHFDSQVAGLDLSFAESRGLDLNDVVIIASILERESQLAEEFPLVSSVIYNRLAKPMRLQLCATVLYTLPGDKQSLTNADLEHQSPYNTYLNDGLPVGPISNPGMRALEAAAHPPETKYLYYVLTGEDGSQTFTETYDAFLRAKQGAR
ncbi:MAG: endolytic transglycosylase MltG, partial [Aeromicrobium sp.]|nr:endolytic transglycosylase MltG [Aeromicrobium sp.]